MSETISVNQATKSKLVAMVDGMQTDMPTLIAYLLERYETEDARQINITDATHDRLVVMAESRGVTVAQLIDGAMDCLDNNYC